MRPVRETDLRRLRPPAVVLLIALTGCHDWVSVPPPGDWMIAHERPSAVRVSSGDSSVVLRSPSLRGDSLVGYPEVDGRQLVAIPFEDVEGIERRKTNAWKTGLLVLGILILASIPGQIASE